MNDPARAARPSNRVEWQRLKLSTCEALQKRTCLKACHCGDRHDTNSSMPGRWTKKPAPKMNNCMSCGVSPANHVPTRVAGVVV